MSAGWESSIRITGCTAWASAGTLANRGQFLYCDSENLDFGAQFKERDSKLTGNRESPADTATVDRYFPKGGITFQPRVDDILMIFMAHFQNVVKSGAGTYQFFRIPNQLNWSSNGTVFSVGTIIGATATMGTGTTPYSLNVDKCFGFSFASGTQSNGIRFTNGIVDKLTLSQKYGEDLICTPEFKFLAGSNYLYPTTYGPLTSFGSFSAYSRFVDYMGTFGISGESFDVDSWQGMFSNNTTDKSKLGQRGYTRFPLSGKWVGDGSFDLELNRDVAVFAESGTANLTLAMFSAAGCQITVAQPNIVYKPSNINLSSGDSLVEFSKPYRAYPPAGTTGPSTIVTVYTGSTFGIGLMGF